MKNYFTIVAITVSIGLNVLFGYMYFKNYVYRLGYTAGQQVVTNEVNTLIGNGQLLIPEQLEEAS